MHSWEHLDFRQPFITEIVADFKENYITDLQMLLRMYIQ